MKGSALPPGDRPIPPTASPAISNRTGLCVTNFRTKLCRGERWVDSPRGPAAFHPAVTLVLRFMSTSGPPVISLLRRNCVGLGAKRTSTSLRHATGFMGHGLDSPRPAPCDAEQEDSSDDAERLSCPTCRSMRSLSVDRYRRRIGAAVGNGRLCRRAAYRRDNSPIDRMAAKSWASNTILRRGVGQPARIGTSRPELYPAFSGWSVEYGRIFSTGN